MACLLVFLIVSVEEQTFLMNFYLFIFLVWILLLNPGSHRFSLLECVLQTISGPQLVIVMFYRNIVTPIHLPNDYGCFLFTVTVE